MITLHWKNRMAARVALEIERIDRFGLGHLEGIAYKAEWQERGSDAQKHCTSARYDAGIMNAHVWARTGIRIVP